MCKVVGLDISLQKTAVCVLDHDGQLVWQGKVDSEPGPLIDKLRLWHDQIDVIGLEACPLSEWLHRHLVAAGFKAIGVETRHAQRRGWREARGQCLSMTWWSTLSLPRM